MTGDRREDDLGDLGRSEGAVWDWGVKWVAPSQHFPDPVGSHHGNNFLHFQVDLMIYRSVHDGIWSENT